MPVPAHGLAHWCAGAGVGEPFVVRRRGPAVARTGVDRCVRSGHRIPLVFRTSHRLCITVGDVCTPKLSYISFEEVSRAAAAGTSVGARAASPSLRGPRPPRDRRLDHEGGEIGHEGDAHLLQAAHDRGIAERADLRLERKDARRGWSLHGISEELVPVVDEANRAVHRAELGMQQRGELVARLCAHRVEPRLFRFFDGVHALPPAFNVRQSGSMPSPGRSGACTLPSPSIVMGSAKPYERCSRSYDPGACGTSTSYIEQ